MPYPTSEILAEAASDLAGCHPLTIVTIPALLHAGRPVQQPLTRLGLPMIQAFGTRQERPVLEAFRLDDTERPYLAVWQSPPVFIRSDYASSTLQRLRTQDIIGRRLFDIAWNDDHTKRVGTALRHIAGEALAELGVKPVNRLSLALWFGRHENLPTLESYLDWFGEEYPLGDTDLDYFYQVKPPSYVLANGGMDTASWGAERPATNTELMDKLYIAESAIHALDVPSTRPLTAEQVAIETYKAAPVDDDLRWTRELCAYPLRSADINRIAQIVLARLAQKRIVLPDAEVLVTRCVSALLIGHVVLQGPPGTGKTTLARALAEAFEVILLESTATSEWSPFHVVGGLQPSADNSLEPSYGKVSDAVLKCAVQVRADVNAEAEGGDDPASSEVRRYQGVWLLVDEFNRADIDKAIGSLYTMLSSCDAENLERSPIDLWFEANGRQQLWVPGRFRIVAAMNDLDTSFVNPISQGLTRRFQFIRVGVPIASTDATSVSPEIQNSLEAAYTWVSSTYGAVIKLEPADEIFSRINDETHVVQQLVWGLRTGAENATGWPVGTAQVVDVFRVLLLQVMNSVEAMLALDWAVADRLVPQMGQLDDVQLQHVADLFNDAGLANAGQALNHLSAPHGL